MEVKFLDGSIADIFKTDLLFEVDSCYSFSNKSLRKTLKNEIQADRCFHFIRNIHKQFNEFSMLYYFELWTMEIWAM